MPRPPAAKREDTLYNQPEARTQAKKKNELPLMMRLTYYFSKRFPSFGKDAKFDAKQQEAFDFLSWDITAEQFNATYKALFMLGLSGGALLGTIFYLFAGRFGIDQMIALAGAGILLILPLVFTYMYLNWPYSAVEREKMLSLAYVPQIVNYLVMSMRLTPNLEKAVQFAANHGKGKIAEDLKKIVWDVQIGRYSSIEEGLDDLAYKWGKYNDDFKQALMLIRASILEVDRERREAILEKASEDVLEGTKEKMDLYARKLQQPTVYLYYFGILLPLLLAILLPIGGSLSKSDLASADKLFLAYNIVIPIVVFFFGKGIVSNKPPVSAPPEIPENYPGLPPTGTVHILGMNLPFRLFAVLLLLTLVFVGYNTDIGVTQDVLNGVIMPVNSLVNVLPPEGLTISGTLGAIPLYTVSAAERQTKIIDNLKVLDAAPSDDTNRDEMLAAAVRPIPHLALFAPYGLFVGQFTIFGIIIGIALALSFYYNGKYGARKKVQDEIRSMEVEFKDAMYALASRMGENKPIEEALRSAVAFLPKSAIGKKVFKRILENITNLGMTLDTAIFDQTFGAMRDTPSEVIRSGLQFLVDSVELGVNVAAKSLIGLSMQMRNTQKINEALKKLLEDVTMMLKTMSTFVAPIVLGVVSSMQRMIINSITSQGSSAQAAPGAQVFGSMNNMFSAEGMKNAAEPAAFILILGIYVLEVVWLLTYFNSQIEDTNNPLHTYTSIAGALPLAAILYCATVFFTGSMFG